MAKVPNLKLNNGNNMPILGLGTWQAAPGEVAKVVKMAITAGYRHLDCAHLYGNEAEIGEALESLIKNGEVTRDELFITSKLWNTYHRPGAVMPALETTLKNLKLDYLDLYLMHWPLGFKEQDSIALPMVSKDTTELSDYDYVDTWEAMEKCVEKGLTKSIGVSNFNSEQVKRLLSACTIKPVTNQVECHPYLNQEKLMNFCKQREITITAYGPLGSPGRPWKGEEPSVLQDPTLLEIAKTKGKTVPQVVLRWIIQRGIAVIPKSSNENRLKENLNVFDFSLEEDQMNSINNLNRNIRFFPMDPGRVHKYYPFHIEF